MYLYKNRRGLSQAEKTKAQAAVEKIRERIQAAVEKIKAAPVGQAVQVVKEKIVGVLRMGLRALGAGETIIIDGKVGLGVISGLSRIGINVNELQAIEDRWVLPYTTPDLGWDAMLNNAGIMAHVNEHLPVDPLPDIPRLRHAVQGIDAFRSDVGDGPGNRTVSDGRLQMTLNELIPLVQWADKVHPREIRNIVNGNLTAGRNDLNARVSALNSGLAALASDVKTFIVAPRDKIIQTLANAIGEAYGALNQAIADQELALKEIQALGAQMEAAQAQAAQAGAAVSVPTAEIQAKIASLQTENTELKAALETKMKSLEGVVGEITKALGI